MGNEWDNNKNEANIVKHGVSFDEAATVLNNPLTAIFDDNVHSDREERKTAIGHSSRSRVLVIIFTQRGENLRIISARPATKREQYNYEHGYLA